LDYDCLGFNTESAAAVFTGGEWKVIDGDHWMFGFGANELDAKRAVDVIRRYRFDAVCYVARPFPRLPRSTDVPQYGLVYLLERKKVTQGAIAGEQCSELDVSGLSVSRMETGWSVVTNTETVFTFGERQREAERALEIIRHHAFRYRCTVGNEGNFRYLRQ
jgi:hypothetical protein